MYTLCNKAAVSYETYRSIRMNKNKDIYLRTLLILLCAGVRRAGVLRRPRLCRRGARHGLRVSVQAVPKRRVLGRYRGIFLPKNGQKPPNRRKTGAKSALTNYLQLFLKNFVNATQNSLTEIL